LSSARIPVYPFGTTTLPPCPPHSASKSLALLALTHFAVKWSANRDALIQLTREPWSQVRKRLRGNLAVKIKHEVLNAPDYHVPLFMTSYPPLGQETDAKERRERLWMKAERF
jgi:hypothetical protein